MIRHEDAALEPSSIEKEAAMDVLVDDEMTRTERVRAAVRGEEVDRVPVAFWHHFRPEGSARRMAEATLDFFDEQFDLDICKIMPDLPYPFPHKSIHTVGDWRLLEPLDLSRSPFVRERLRTIALLRDELGEDTPIVVTLFSPLAEAMYACADHATFLKHLHDAPAVVHGALTTLAQNLGDAMELYLAAGADGVFYSVQGAMAEDQDGGLGEARYREFGRPYDLMALRRVQDGWLNILHVHGNGGLLMDTLLDYPVDVLNWSDRLTGLSLREVRGKTSKCLMGGWHEFGALSNGPAEAIQAEAEDAIKQTGGRKFILANGCSVPDDTPEEWLEAARDIAEELEVN
jgi:uroporphyrinogen decarboxylase